MPSGELQTFLKPFGKAVNQRPCCQAENRLKLTLNQRLHPQTLLQGQLTPQGRMLVMSWRNHTQPLSCLRFPPRLVRGTHLSRYPPCQHQSRSMPQMFRPSTPFQVGRRQCYYPPTKSMRRHPQRLCCRRRSPLMIHQQIWIWHRN